jgi:hypothetical protein
MLDCGSCPAPPPREPLGFRLSLSLDWPVVTPLVDGVGGAAIAAQTLPPALFADGWDPRYTGYEDISHALLFHQFVRGRFTVDVAIALRVLQLALDTRLDDSSYLRVAVALDRAGTGKRSLALTLFPLSSDRMRLGYGYRTSWGGSPIFFKDDPTWTMSAQVPLNSTPDPGLRLQYTDERLSAWAGVKLSALINRNPMVNELEAIWAVLGGLAVEAVPDHLRLEAGGGYFYRGTNPTFYSTQGMGPYVDHSLDTYGGSFQVSLWNRLPPSLSLDYGRYRNDPTTAARLLAEPQRSAGLGWLLQAEASVVATSLQDPVTLTKATWQVGYAAALNARLQLGGSRVRLDAMIRSVEFLLLDGPSLVPYQGFPAGSTAAPDLFASLAYDYRFDRARLTVGASLEIDRPATLSLPATIPATCAPGSICGPNTLVVWGLGDYSLLPVDASGKAPAAQTAVAAKVVARKDFLDYFSALLTLYYLHDPNQSKLVANPDLTYTRVFGSPHTLGLFLTLQARF